MKPRRIASRSAVITSFVIAFSTVSPTHAASDSWDGSTDAAWATGTNWLLGTSPPGAGETATFDGAGNGNTTIDLGAGVTLGSVVFDTSSAAAYTLGSGAVGSQTLTLDTTGNAITMNSTVAANQAINSNLALTVTRTLANPATYYAVTNNSLTNPLTLAGGISASTGGVKVLNVTGSGNTAISGAITSGSGNMSLFKTGSGTLTLSGGGTFSGNGVRDGANFDSSAVFREGLTVLNGGTYSNSNGELVIGGVATHGGAGTNTTLQLNNGTTLDGISWLSIGRGNGTGSVSSNLTLNGNATVTTTNLSAGFNAGNTGNLPKAAITLNNTSQLTVTATGTGTLFNIGESAGSDVTVTVNDSAVVNRTAGGSTALAATQNQGAVQIGREGKGTVIMNGGTFNAMSTDLGRGVNNATAQNGTLTIKTGAIYNNEGDFRMAFAGGASGQANLNLQGGTLNIGTTTARTLHLGTFDGPSATVTIDSGNLNLNANSSIRFNASGNTGTKVINLNDGAITSFSDNQITANGSGVLDMKQAGSTSTNTFNLNGGTLAIRQVVSTSNTGTRIFNFNGGTLKATGDSAAFFGLNTGTARANVRNGGAVINTNGFNVTVAQALEHSDIGGDNATDGGLTKNSTGTLTLNGVNTYTGKTTVTGGSLALGSGGSIANSSEIALNGGNFNVSAVAGFSTGASQALTGSGSITGDITVTGTLAIGSSPGTMTFNDDLTIGASAVSSFELTDIAFGSGSYDLAQGGDGSQTVTFDGTLNLFFSGGTYANNSSVQIFDFENYSGDFTTVSFSGLGSGQSAVFDASTGLVTVIPEPDAALLGGLGMLALLRRRRN